MAKMMKKHGDTTPIYFDQELFDENSSDYEILDVEPVASVADPAPKAKKAKPVTTEDELNTAFSLDDL